ncbi:MAG: sugar kinase [Clostridia bacterium]|nr:sugar kinase [Clostridia bacterium]NDO18177.1 sugar kinase [Lachnospiraceae bacterium MD329]
MKFKENTDYDLIGLGEVMLRLSPPDKEKISQSETFVKNAGGSELNVVSGAAMLGIRSAIITKLPENKMGHFIRNKIRYGNVSDDYIIYDHSPEKRLGIYYYESGAYPRKSSVIYDRANSSVCSLSLSDLPSDIYDKTKIFHVSSITMALSPSLKETTLELIKRFKEAGTYISFDVNYRASLWSEEEAREVVESIFPYVDFLFVSEETSRRMLQRTGTLEEIMQGYANDYGCTLIATTRREVISPTHHNFNSKMLFKGKFYEEKPYNNIEVIDRIGSGDAYLAGVLYGLVKYGTPERAIEIGNALSAVKNTVPGDMSASSIEEIESVIKAHKATGHQDEMVR